MWGFMLPMGLFTFTLTYLMAHTLRFLSRRANWQDLSYWATAFGPFMPFLLLFAAMIYPWPESELTIPLLFFPFDLIRVVTPHDYALISILGVTFLGPIIEGQAYILLLFYSLLGGEGGFAFYLLFARPRFLTTEE